MPKDLKTVINLVVKIKVLRKQSIATKIGKLFSTLQLGKTKKKISVVKKTDAKVIKQIITPFHHQATTNTRLMTFILIYNAITL